MQTYRVGVRRIRNSAILAGEYYITLSIAAEAKKDDMGRRINMKILIDCDYIVYKCCASAETEMDFGDDVMIVTSNFSDAMKCVNRDLDV